MSNVTSAPKIKVIAATTGAALGSSFSIILVYLLTETLKNKGITLPDKVLEAVGTIFTTIVTALAGYYTPPGANETSVVTDGKVKSALID